MTNAKETAIIFGNIDKLWFMASTLPEGDSEAVHALCFDRGMLVEDINKCGGIVSDNHMRIIRELGERANNLLYQLWVRGIDGWDGDVPSSWHGVNTPKN